jgi:alpha-glucosidase (family GH31 glycosyl hydrolase)
MGDQPAKSRPNKLTRRRALLHLGAAGAGTFLCEKLGASWWATGQAHVDHELIVAGQRAEFWITEVSPKTLRLSVLPVRESDQVEGVEQTLDVIDRKWPSPSAQINSPGQSRTVNWGDHTLNVTTDPLTVSIKNKSGRLIQQIQIMGSDGSVGFACGDGPVFGLGEGGHQFDRRGSGYPMKNGQHSPDLQVIGARMPIPWLVGAEGWGLYFHQPFGTFDLKEKDGRFAPSPDQPALPLDMFVVASEDPAEILSEYARLTGFPHLPPIWALGYQQSHRTLSSREEILEEGKTFREKKLPCDLLIYLGTGFCPSGWNTGHGSFTFNHDVFPDPKQMIRELHDEHFRVAVHVVLRAKHLHGQASDSGAAAEDPEDVAHYWKEHLDVLRMGVDAWWPDEGDWLPPIERLVRNRMYWEAPQLEHPNLRPYALHRNGYAGLQRYGWLWSGDVESLWETLRAQVPVGINTGLSGIPLWGTDTGGFVTTPELTGELYVRWFQFSSFCPLFRSHGRTWKLRLPWGWNTGDYGPKELERYRGHAGLPDPSELHNAEVEPICRKYLDLRYRLMPYLYTFVRESHQTGMPIMRALWLHYADDPQAVERSDEYLWGRDILVAPVTEKGATSRHVYLPRGTWYDYWTERAVEGGREVERPVDLGTLPLYVRAGAVIPVGPVKQYATQPSDEPLTFVVYPGADGNFEMYEDDGISFDYRKGQFMQMRAAWGDRRRQFHLSLANGSKMLPPTSRKIEVRQAGDKKTYPLAFNGKPKKLSL